MPQRRLWSGWYTAVLLAAGILFAILALPRGYSNDLSVIGQGQRVVVIIHDSKRFQSMDFLSLMNGIRDEADGDTRFCVADIKEPHGKEFAAAQQIKPPSLLLFAEDGTRLGTIQASRSPEEIKRAINRLFQRP